MYIEPEESLTISRVLYFCGHNGVPVSLPLKATIIYLGRPLLNGSSDQPNAPRARAAMDETALRYFWSCSRWGLPGKKSPAFLVVSYTTVPPLPVHRKVPSAVCFCGTILQLALTGCYPAPCPVEPGLSSGSMQELPAIVCQTFRNDIISYAPPKHKWRFFRSSSRLIL